MRILAPLVLIASASPALAAGSIEVTRFHVDPPAQPAAIAIVPAQGGDPQALEFRSLASAVSRELARLGYAEGVGASPLIAEVQLDRGVRTDYRARSPVSIGVGTGSYGRGFGFGLGTSFGLGGGAPRETMVTKLTVVLKNRADGKPVWEGRAETADRAKSAAAQASAIFDRLSAAMFKGFPGKSGETIVVR